MNKSDTGHSNTAIARSAGVIGFATLVSRILGFIRDIVIAQLFGVFLYAQAFVVALKLPNLFRDLVGEGASNAALVPVFSEYLARGKKEEFWELTNVLMNVLLVILSGITLLGMLLAPVLVRLIAPGFAQDPEKFAATVALSRIIFPYILLIGLAAYCTAILNSLRHFTVPAFAPCLLNIAIIVCALIWGEGIRGLASGVLIGGVLQLAVQIPLVYKRGFRFRLARTFRHPALRQIARLMTPRLFSSAIYQLNNFVDSIFGSLALFVGEGGVAALYFSYRLIQFPLGIFSNALAQAILPTLSFQVLDPENHPKFKETLLFGLSSILLIMIPASAAFMVLSRLIIETLFAGGRFNEYSVTITSGALFFYSIGLSAYAAVKILQCGFFALKDTLTPTIISGVGLFLNIFLNAIFMFPLGLNGLALATSISGIVIFLLLFYIIDKRVNGLNIRWLAVFSLKVLIASIGMAAVCVLGMRSNISFAGPIATRVARLVFPISLGLISYIIFCWGLRIEQVKSLWRLIGKRPPPQ